MKDFISNSFRRDCAGGCGGGSKQGPTAEWYNKDKGETLYSPPRRGMSILPAHATTLHGPTIIL